MRLTTKNRLKSLLIATILSIGPWAQLALGGDSHRDADLWQTKALKQNLGRSPEWARVLLYTPHWIGSASGLVDQDEFFLAPDGRSMPEKELIATIDGFFSPGSAENNMHPVCRYPRRLKFIQDALGLQLPAKNRPTCEAYHEWKTEHPITGISLVFASNYLNNPASLYGHTFLRLHRLRDDGTGSSPLLDYAVNFAANPTTTNPVLYPLLGLFGRFFGTFSLMPYYIKVQEYNNAESRDLYEYPLTLTADEVSLFMDALWEAGPYGIRYWYMDENCSYVLLAMIESIRPSLDVTEGFYGVVSPKDTLLVLNPFNLLAPPIRRPATMTRFIVRRKDLTPTESEIVTRQIKFMALLPELKAADDTSKMRMLDTVIEWISWKEHLAGSRLPVQYAELWTESLATRAALKIKSPPLDLSQHPAPPPEDGHKSHRSYAAFRLIDHQPSEVMFGLRLTLHDFLSPPTGYSPEQETEMGDFQGVVHRNRANKTILELERFTFLRIFSAPAFDSLIPSPAWTLTLQSQRMWGYGRDAWLAHKFEGGAGLAYALKPLALRGWFIPVAVVGRLLPEMSPGIHGGLGLRSGIAVDPSPEVRIVVSADVDRWASQHEGQTIRDLTATASWMHKRSNEFRANIRARDVNLINLQLSSEIIWMNYF